MAVTQPPADLVRPGRRLDRIANAAATLLPALGLVGVAWQLWGDALHWQDLVVFAVTMTLTGFGVTVGYHRLFTHRSFQTTRSLRVLFAILWVVAGLAFAFGLGLALTGTVAGGVTGLLWGGAVRILVLHHITFSINSLCHFFGRRTFDTDDESRNLRWLAPFSFGEAWHNNHHAFPTSAAHGLTRWQPDPSKLVIYGLEKVGLAWDVVRISPARIAATART